MWRRALARAALQKRILAKRALSGLHKVQFPEDPKASLSSPSILDRLAMEESLAHDALVNDLSSSSSSSSSSSTFASASSTSNRETEEHDEKQPEKEDEAEMDSPAEEAEGAEGARSLPGAVVFDEAYLAAFYDARAAK